MSLTKAYWRWDIESDLVEGGEFLESLFRLNDDNETIHFKEVIRPQLKEEERVLLKDHFNEHVESKGEIPFRGETTHLFGEENEPVSVLWFGEVIRWSKEGKPLQMAGLAKKKVDKPLRKKLSKVEAFLFFRLMDHLNESIFFKDLESRFIRINKECARKFGLEDPSKAIGKTDFDIFGIEHAQEAFEDEQRIIATEEPIFQKVEKETFADDRTKIKWASTSKLPLYDENGELIGTFGITRDITHQKNIEESLRHNDELFTKLSELAPGFLYLHEVDVDGNVSFPFVSDGIKEMFDLPPEAIQNSFSPLMKKVHREDLKRVMKSIGESVKNATEWDCEYRIIHPEKGWRWVKGKAKPEIQEDGSLLSPGFITDITEIKAVSEANAELKQQFQSVFNTVPNLIFVKDGVGKYVMANDAACKFFGKEREELLGSTDLDLGVPKEKADMFLEADAEVIETKAPQFFSEIKTTLANSEEVWHQTIKVPFQQTGTNKPAVLTIVTDITERKQKELELNETLDIIGDQNKRLTNFAHIVSHNLRNHAGNISMLLTLYDTDESEEEQEETLGYLKTASDRLNESINDLNEIVDLQQKTINQHKEVNINEYVTKTKEVLLTEILKHNVTFEEDIPKDLSLEYNPAYLESIMLNLFSNAIKYRKPELNPIIGIKAYEEGEHTFFEVSDNGLGLDLDKHGEKLFGMYNTFHGNENSKGIGLFITKNQIESMGGKISVESESGYGTTFKIRLK